MTWRHHIEGNTQHVWPENDLVEHDHKDDDGGCVCIPRTEPIPREDGTIGWVIVHHALDGREATE
ncbi:hypothetical protein SEA_LYMARA_59 [Arthrobacter phage Lymara]|uniref:Uncharacterized protein n=1 Tax=Arthrobacter phage Lymara TaxID=2599828 RepID=A0A5J6TVM3_9CAUD|nr:hypothetical protein HYQ01_gp059 [Arthrobacter phage Lymara]QFG14860.1 hypothetical protein SEA_LYMARA_59 [Arthrobacter phage Lymara]